MEIGFLRDYTQPAALFVLIENVHTDEGSQSTETNESISAHGAGQQKNDLEGVRYISVRVGEV